jgi:hemerythrin
MENNKIVEWEDRFLMGIPLIDGQHKKLVEMTNTLFTGCLGGKEQANVFFQKTIHGAVEYVRYHFYTEEKLQLLTDYPGFYDHKKEHGDFIKEVIRRVRDFENGRPFVPNVFSRYLRDWVLTHIGFSDKLYAEYFSDLKKQGGLQTGPPRSRPRILTASRI